MPAKIRCPCSNDVLRKEAGCTTELDYTEQTSWLLFLKYLDDFEQDKSTEAALEGRKYTRILDGPYGWGILGRLFGRSHHETKSTLDLPDIQGFILRGYRMPMVRHFLLSVATPTEARKLLGRFVSGDETDAPQITTAEDWHVGFAPGPGDNPADVPRHKPDYCLNVGITWPGMIALEVKDRIPAISFKSFGAFIDGAAKRAGLVGDTGASDPQNWIGAFCKGDDHVMVTLHAMSPEALTTYSQRLSALFADGNAFREIWRTDGMALTEIFDGKPTFTSRVHFGYTDGVSMTTIHGGPEKYPPDHQEPCEPWLFVLQDDAENYLLPEPRELGLNGSFAVFRMIDTAFCQALPHSNLFRI
jgi:hypothetical protein